MSGSGRTALVTGASSGIGTAFAERLAADGYDLILTARRRQRLDELAVRLRSKGILVDIVPGDLADRDHVRILETILAGDRAISLLVNNAGFGAYGPFIELDPEIVAQQIAVNLTAPVRLTRAVLPGMVARHSGVVISVASTFAFSSSVKMPTRQRANYVATKTGLIAFTELIAHELEGTGVVVQALCPGVVRTEFHDGLGGRPPGVPVFEPADVVGASLAALAMGEVICVPHLPDAAALERLAGARNALWGEARASAIAARYKATGGDERGKTS